MAPSFIRSTALTWTEPDDPEAQPKKGVGSAWLAPFIALDFAHRCSRCRTTRFARRAAGSCEELRFIARARVKDLIGVTRRAGASDVIQAFATVARERFVGTRPLRILSPWT
jgi:hypothetical protein